MNSKRTHSFSLIAILAALLSLVAGIATADIPGVQGPTFSFTAKDDYITSGDGALIYMWGYADDSGHNNMKMQFPGPTMIVNQGDTVTIALTNELPNPSKNRVSMVFPGQLDVTATGGSSGLMTRESTGPTDTVTYSFTADRPGTYIYHSGSRPELQTEMGLMGAIIVRPTGYDPLHPSTHGAGTGTDFEREYLYLVSQVDTVIHDLIAAGDIDQVDMSKQRARQWFINGRSLADDLFPHFAPWLPTQPYSALVLMEPGDRVAVRFVGASRDTHPPHLHGNNFIQISRDGKLLQSAPGLGADLAVSDNTITVASLATYDVIWEWTGKDLGWDIYGNHASDCIDLVDNRTGMPTPASNPHSPGDGWDDAGDNAWEWCDDHGKPAPVVLPELQDMTFGGFYSGSPFLGGFGSLPPGQGGLNLNGGFMYPWHSHTEFELVNNNIFPGGMFTVVIIEPPGTL